MLGCETKLCIDRLLLNKGRIKRFFIFIYIVLTKYKCISSLRTKSTICFFINHDLIIRHDHINIFNYISDELNKRLNIPVNYFRFERKFNWLFITSLFFFLKSRNLYSLMESQFNDVIENISTRGFQKVIVFCDTTPLQNFVCDFYNERNVDTYSFQHGFYIEDFNETFKEVYKASNAANFFVWDERTLFFMRKHKGKKERNFIQAGPINTKAAKLDRVYKINNSDIAIYGCGRDQIKQNLFLLELTKIIISEYKRDVHFICHPKFSLSLRIKYFLKHKVKLYPNRFKYADYKLHLVLNSGVFMELREKGKPYLLLNDYFDQKISLIDVCSNIFNKEPIHNHNSLRPFFDEKEAEQIVFRELAS